MPTNAISTLRSRPPPSRHSAAHKIGFCSCSPSAQGVSGLIIKQGEPTNGLMIVPNISRRLPKLGLIHEATWITSNLHPTSKFNEPAASAFTTVYHPAPCESFLTAPLTRKWPLHEVTRWQEGKDPCQGKTREKGREKLAIKKLAK